MVITFEVTTNQAQTDGVKAEGGDNWSGYFKKKQKFAVRVQGQQVDIDSHAHVGLIQTLLSSTRTGVYTGGVDGNVELRIQPRDGPPTLDARQSNRPWYDDDCEAKPITAAYQTFTMVDSPLPQTSVKIRNVNDTTNIKTINSFTVNECFLLTLLRYDGMEPPTDWLHNSNVLAQWEWSYSFTLRPGGYTPNVVHSASSPANHLAATDIDRVIFTGQVATTDPVRELFTPDGWQKYYP